MAQEQRLPDDFEVTKDDGNGNFEIRPVFHGTPAAPAEKAERPVIPVPQNVVRNLTNF